MGVCEYCGQAVLDTETNEEATENCQCFEAEHWRKLRRAAEEAKAIIRELFGEGCAKRGLVELNAGIIQALYSLADLMGRGDISSVTVQLPGVCKVNMKLSGYAIKVERVEGRKYSDVAGEQ